MHLDSLPVKAGFCEKPGFTRYQKGFGEAFFLFEEREESASPNFLFKRLAMVWNYIDAE